MRGSLVSRTLLSGLLAVSFAAAPAGPALHAAAAAPSGPFVNARANEPVILTGAQLPGWAGPPATGLAATYPSGADKTNPIGDHTRSAHNGNLVLPPTGSAVGVKPDEVAAYRWDSGGWVEVPVQVDKKYPYFLANGHSSFGFYSGTDEELTFDWSPTQHAVGEEAWKKVFGDCGARYQLPGAAGDAEYAAAVQSGAITPNPGVGGQPTVPPDDYHGPMADPVSTLTTNDEVVFMAGDAGGQAPVTQAAPEGASNGQTITVADPTSGTIGYVYLFTKPGGSSFKVTDTSNNGYVAMTRDANANEWVDRYTWAPSDYEKLGTSNTGYGPNLPGTVCRTSPGNDANPKITTPDGQSRPSTDRVPRDGMTLTTPTYRLYASGRWMVRQYSITKPGTTFDYGPNLISRWKGRAFQQSPDSTVSVVGFEDEQVNWEVNSALLGWKAGPVRAIRETWGADSGTNVTKTEVYYRDADVFHYHVRVHPIPPDGLYSSWDYRLGAVTTYLDEKTANDPTNPTGGVPIDGRNDNVGHVDKVPVSQLPAAGQTDKNAYFDTCDPTFDVCTAVDHPEEVAGPNGSMVYVTELVGPTSAAHPAVVPYYRDDACLDDGTGDGGSLPGATLGGLPIGDGPAPRPYPKSRSTDPSVQAGYVAWWKAHGAPATLTYADLKCDPDPSHWTATTPPWQKFPFQGAIGQHGLHFFITGDSDNATLPKPVDEVDAQQWRYAIPMGADGIQQNLPKADLGIYGNNVVVPLRAVAAPINDPAASTPEVPWAPLLPLAGLLGGGWWLRRRRRAPAL
jgi:hypothetical protein